MSPIAVDIWAFVAVPAVAVIGCVAFGLTPTLWAFAGLTVALWLAEAGHYLDAKDDMARSMELFGAVIFAGPPTVVAAVLGAVKLTAVARGWLK